VAERGPRRDFRGEFARKVESEENRKMRARQEKDRAVWFGLGTFGLVGWSVAIPTVIGIALGIWIDTRWPSRFSWTLMLLFIGVVIGCFNAWYWVQQMIQRREEETKR
jgi:ATP synthase protein I